ncbi:MAG TPA: zinc ribbon domain-containing protein [Clostridiales bacterium]|nr:zinc ribbon domain-containing protein [Clostridiales bacterium]
MYCQKCGQYNADNAIYCSNDGELLLHKSDKVFMSKQEVFYCKHCGERVESYFLYCTNCGQSQFKTDIGKKTIKSPKTETKLKQDKGFKTIDFITPLKFAGVAVLLLLIVSLIASTSINKNLNEEINDYLLVTGIDPHMDIKFLDTIDLTLLSHLSELAIEFDSIDYGYGTATFRSDISLFLLAPLVIFVILGILKGRKDLKTEKHFRLIDHVLVALYYALGLLIISRFSVKETYIPIPFDDDYMIISKYYRPFIVFFNSFITTLVFFLLGYGIYIFIKKESERLYRYRYIFNGIFSITFGYFISLIVYMIAFRENISGILIDLEYVHIEELFTEPSFIWNIINFNTIFYSEFGNVHSLSLFKNTSLLKDSLDNLTIVVLYILTLVPFILFFFQGRREKKAGDGNLYLKLAYNSISYSILISLFNSIAKVKFELFGSMIDQPISLSIGFKPSITFFTCFIFSYLASLAGAFLANSEYKKVGYVYEK